MARAPHYSIRNLDGFDPLREFEYDVPLNGDGLSLRGYDPNDKIPVFITTARPTLSAADCGLELRGPIKEDVPVGFQREGELRGHGMFLGNLYA